MEVSQVEEDLDHLLSMVCYKKLFNIYIYTYIFIRVNNNIWHYICIISESFKGFETWILYCNHTSIMTSNMGRTKRCRLLVITGNRKGLAGFVMLSGSEFKSTVNAAKVKAGQRLIYVERHNDHTGR